MASNRDPYDVLGVRRGANQDEIKRAYRELVKKYHPDNYKNHPLENLAKEKMQEINEAYDTLTSGNTQRSSDNYQDQQDYNPWYGNQRQSYGSPYRNNNNPYYRSGGYSGGCCNDLACLCCADSCCECLGGDLCACM